MTVATRVRIFYPDVRQERMRNLASFITVATLGVEKAVRLSLTVDKKK